MRFLTTLPFLTLTLSILLTASSSYAEVFYKWEDDSGSWVYGEHPPLGVEAIEIKTHSNRNNDSDSKKDELANKVANAEEAAKQQRELYCKQARENVEALSSEAAIQQRDDVGNVTMLSDEDRATELKKAQMALESYC